MTMKIFGHKSPDTDSVVSSIAAAYLLGGEAYVQGDIGAEAKFVLEKFGLAIPKRLESVAGEAVAIVDTTEPAQLPDDIAEADIKFIFDHHNMGGVKTKAPFEGWFLPAGCTATILCDYAECEGKPLSASLAGAMAMAIISDTTMFKSPTTTDHDRKAVAKLAKIADIDYEKLGMEMLRVKSSVAGETADSLIGRDYKEFDINSRRLGIGQLELVDSSVADSMIGPIKKRLQELRVEKGYDDIVLLVTDIMKEGSRVLAYGADAGKIAQILGGELENDECWVPGLLSRKKQVVAPLNEKL